MENVFLSLLVIILVVGAALTDFLWHKIPNILTFPSMGVGIVGHGVAYGWEGLGFSLGGLGLGLVLLLGFYAMGGMAAGDVKLMAAVGAFVGPLNVFLVFLMTAILGGFYSIGMMIQRKDEQRSFISDVLYVPNMKNNLLSLVQLLEKSYSIC